MTRLESFDDLTRAIAAPVSRRRALAVALGGFLASLLGLGRPRRAVAVTCSGPTTVGPSPCTAGTTPCGPCCCRAGIACTNSTTGTCGCPAGTTPCGLACCVAGVACANASTSTCNGAVSTCLTGQAPCGRRCCAAGQPCSNAACCTPTTCAAQGKNCGQISDGCGGLLNCGTCTSPETCGGGGVPGVCGCAGFQGVQGPAGSFLRVQECGFQGVQGPAGFLQTINPEAADRRHYFGPSAISGPAPRRLRRQAGG